MKKKDYFNFLMLILVAVIATPVDAHAYLDLGTGSFMLQMFLASVAAALFVVKQYWGKIKTSIRIKFLKNGRD